MKIDIIFVSITNLERYVMLVYLAINPINPCKQILFNLRPQLSLLIYKYMRTKWCGDTLVILVENMRKLLQQEQLEG